MKNKKIEKKKLPKGVAWYCKKHKTFADTFQLNCAHCSYPDTKTKRNNRHNKPNT